VSTKPEPDTIYSTQKECNQCKAKVTKGKIHLDHIVVLANGGKNDLKNIQVLCIPCHLQKTKHEKEEDMSTWYQLNPHLTLL
jgi:5-methylcytosine-specific restriction protein A